MTNHDPIFERFHRRVALNSDSVRINFMGAESLPEWDVVRPDLLRGVEFSSGAAANTDYYPPKLSGDYYEWISLLESIYAAMGTFNMIDLGAGYGRWGLNAVCAISALKDKRDLTAQVTCVEPSTARFKWMRNAFAMNSKHCVDYRLIHGAIVVEDTPAEIALDPHDYGGQLSEPHTVSGCRQKVNLITLKDVITRKPVDLIDMDIQGLEEVLIPWNIDLINFSVKRMHINTHSFLGEQLLVGLLKDQDWEILRYYSRECMNDVPYGKFLFDDGIIYCRNKRFYR